MVHSSTMQSVMLVKMTLLASQRHDKSAGSQPETELLNSAR